SVGDYVTMYCLDSDSQVSLEIVGIFSGTEGMGNNALSISDLPANQGFVDYDTMFENFGRELDGYNEIDIYVEDPEGIHNVYNEIKNLSALKNKTLALSINTEDYNTISNPLEHLKEMVQTLLILIVCVSIIILTLLLMIWTRGRKREIGILLSIGESRRSIMTQFFAEVMMIGLFAFGASICLSNAISGIASEFLIAQVDSSVENLKLVISVQQVLPVYISSCVIILLSVVVASWSVLRLNPRDIFAKMS
ncbi:ABC transporter permease, partial [Anaerosporobacter sp.]|uniref:ABC transporter permease n=1 Tax=Anaerosporobacter sp. TaxID=1872529 RepID=UPI00286ECE16